MKIYEIKNLFFFQTLKFFKAGEERWFFTDESVFTRICARRSWMQIRLIDRAYEEVKLSEIIQKIINSHAGASSLLRP